MNAELVARALVMLDDFLDLPAGEAESRLAALARDQPALAKELRNLLAEDARTGLLDDGVQTIVCQAVRNELDGYPAMSVGTFRLVRVLGRGGMGEVWLAERRDGDFVQQVAVKLLKRGMDSDAISARFILERRILAELNHPGIARFVDGGVSSDGRLYYAMEYVQGRELDSYVREFVPDVKERVRLIAEVCDAVAHAQNHLVVHRDLKPSNVLIDEQGRAHVLDFGIAKLLGERSVEKDLTETGSLVFSPAYAAPEQLLGESITTATDVYALGLILYELLSGELPNARRQCSLESLRKNIDSQTEAPSVALKRRARTTTLASEKSELTRGVRTLSGELDLIVLTALQRDPARRYANAAALAADLRNWLSSRPLAARRDTRGYRLRKYVARNRIIVGSASLTLVALIAGLGIALWQAAEARAQARIAQQQTARAEQEAATGRRITEFALSLVHELSPTSRTTSSPKTPQQLLRGSISRVRSELSMDADPDARAAMLNRLGMLLSVTGDLAEAEGAVQEAMTIAATRSGRDLPFIQFNLAALRMQQARNDEAEQLLLDALKHIPDSVEGVKTQAMAQSYLARIARGREELALAMQRIELAKPLFTRAWGADHPNTIELDGHRGLLFFELGSYHAAQQAFEQAIAGFNRVGGPDFPRLMAPLSGLARVQLLRGDVVAAEQNFLRALAIGQSKMGAADPFVISTQLELILLLMANGELIQAQTLLDGIDRSNLTGRPMQLSMLARTQARLAQAEGHAHQAKAHFQAAETQARLANAKPNVRLANILAESALNAFARGDDCEAMEQYRAASAMFGQIPNASLVDRSAFIRAHALVQAQAGDVTGAREYLSAAISELRSLAGDQALDLGYLSQTLTQVSTQQRGLGTAHCPSD